MGDDVCKWLAVSTAIAWITSLVQVDRVWQRRCSSWTFFYDFFISLSLSLSSPSLFPLLALLFLLPPPILLLTSSSSPLTRSLSVRQLLCLTGVVDSLSSWLSEAAETQQEQKSFTLVWNDKVDIMRSLSPPESVYPHDPSKREKRNALTLTIFLFSKMENLSLVRVCMAILRSGIIILQSAISFCIK